MPKFDRYLIYFGLFLPFAVAAFLFGLWLGPQVRIEVPLLMILGTVAGLVMIKLVHS